MTTERSITTQSGQAAVAMAYSFIHGAWMSAYGFLAALGDQGLFGLAMLSAGVLLLAIGLAMSRSCKFVYDATDQRLTIGRTFATDVLPLGDIETIEFPGRPDVFGPPVTIKLCDGRRLRCHLAREGAIRRSERLIDLRRQLSNWDLPISDRR